VHSGLQWRHGQQPLVTSANRDPEYGNQRTTLMLREVIGQMVNYKAVEEPH
jgi:hypothetical protein